MVQRIYLNGFMGSGKSTTGPLLAAQLNWAFVDMDAIIEERLGMPIAAYFKEAGEPAFRKIEQEVLHDTRALNQYVIAVGGGALCQQDNLEWALAHGLVVYLEVSVDELINRLRKEHATRPMLHGPSGELLDDEAVHARISSLLEGRLDSYRQSHLTVKTDGQAPSDIADHLFQISRARL